MEQVDHKLSHGGRIQVTYEDACVSLGIYDSERNAFTVLTPAEAITVALDIIVKAKTALLEGETVIIRGDNHEIKINPY